MGLYDQCLNRAAVSEFDAFDLNDVDKAFAHVTSLKYQQIFSLTGQPLKLLYPWPFFVPGQALKSNRYMQMWLSLLHTSCLSLLICPWQFTAAALKRQPLTLTLRSGP